MKSIFAALLTGACALQLGAASAQQGFTVQQLNGPITHAGNYDVGTGIFTPDTGADTTPVAVYSNKTTNGSFFGPANITNMDWGVPNFGGGGATITSILIGYATNQTAGAPTLRIRLHQGATGNGVKGTEVLNVLVPIALSTGGTQGFTQTVTLATPLALPDGPLGWSYTSTLANTGPLLVGPPNGAGVISLIDQYNANTGAYLGSGNFGATGPFASFVMELVGRVNTPPAQPWVKYGVANGVTLTGDGPATPGSTDNSLYIKGTINKKAILVAGLVQSDLTTGQGLKLYAFPWLVFIPELQLQGVLGELTLPVTIDPALVTGTKIYLQAFSQDLSNNYSKWSKGTELTIQ